MKKKSVLKPAAAMLALSLAFGSFVSCGKNVQDQPGHEATKVTKAPGEEYEPLKTSKPAEKEPDEPVSDALGKYNKHDYKALLAFLEIADKNGVRNGEKLNPDYDPTDPDTWGKEGICRITWTEDGYLEEFELIEEGVQGERILDLRGEAVITGFEKLKWLNFDCSNITKLVVDGCPELNDISFRDRKSTRLNSSH